MVDALAARRFDRYAEEYLTSSSHAQGPELQRLVQVVRPEAHWSLLDVATGGGHTALAFAPHVRSVVALDLAGRMLAVARRHLRSSAAAGSIRLVRGAAEALPFAPATFDVVTCRIAPHHFAAPGRFVLEAARVMRAGGLLALQDLIVPDDTTAARHVDAFERLRDPSHVRALTQLEWRTIAESAGLSPLHEEVVLKRHELGAWAARQGGGPDVVEQLQRMLRVAPRTAIEWLAPEAALAPSASFVNRHLILVARKTGAGSYLDEHSGPVTI